jgi:hypothetical protein
MRLTLEDLICDIADANAEMGPVTDLVTYKNVVRSTQRMVKMANKGVAEGLLTHEEASIFIELAEIKHLTARAGL